MRSVFSLNTLNTIAQVYYYTCATCVYVLMLKCTPPVPPLPPPPPAPLKSPSSLHPPPVCGLHHSVEHQQRASYQLVFFLNTNTEIPDTQTQIQYQDRNSKTNIISKKGIIQVLENNWRQNLNQKRMKRKQLS